MFGISCLVRNTTLRHDLGDLVEFIAYTRVAKNADAGVQSVYNDIRTAGIEVDLQTVAFIYNDVLPKSYAQFDSDHDVAEYALKSFNDAVRRAALLEPPEPVELQIGQNRPDIEVVNGIANMFTKLNTPATDNLYSDMRTMQEALWKGVKRKLNLTNQSVPKTNKDWQELLHQALGYENLGLTDINGRLNGIADLYESMKETLKEATDQLEAKGDFATAEKWHEMVDALKASTYSLLFSKAEAKSFITGILKDAGFAKKLNSGKTVIDWDKLSNNVNSAYDLQNNVERVLRDKGYSQSVVDGVVDSFTNEFNDLHSKITQWRLKQLDRKSDALERASKKRSDLKRLSELHNLGIFQHSYDKLLSSVIGISGLQADDIADLEQLAKAASDLYREVDKNYGSDIFASSAFQTIQRNIDRIVQRNINNKTVLMRIVSAIKNMVDVLMTGLLMGPLTIVENFLSGFKEMASPIWIGKAKLNSTDRQAYKSVLMDVLSRGQAFGEEVGSFAPRELYSNSLRFNRSANTVGEISENLLYLLLTPARIGLLGFDSANKVVITNKTFYNSIFKALVQHGTSREDATKILNEALHGQKFEDAKDQAGKLINQVNLQLPVKYHIPANTNTITRLANDLVKANLNSNGVITNEMIESILKGSYHVAGYGLGHEPNNLFSSMIKGARDKMIQKEQQLRVAKKWDSAAWMKLTNTFVNGMIFRFLGGATNWVVLRLQGGLGLGLATGFNGKWNDDLDFTNQATLEQSIKDRQGARNQIGRALTGISYTAIGYFALYLLTQGGADDREKKKKRLNQLNANREAIKRSALDRTTKSAALKEIDAEIKELSKEANIYQVIKQNYEGNRLFKKVSPDIMLLNYYMDTDRFGEMNGVLNFIVNTTGIASDYSTAGKFQNAMEYLKNGQVEEAKGTLASIAGDRFAVPLWRAYKEWWKLGRWITGHDVSSEFKQPTSIAEGMWGGGAMEDWGVWHRNSSITILPGVGPGAIQKYKEQGIENMDDLKTHPGWENMMYINDNGKPQFILDKTDRENAKTAAEKYFKE